MRPALPEERSIGLGSFSAKVITDIREFDSFRSAWNRIVDASADPNIFLRHEWFDAAWQWRSSRSALHLVALQRDGALAAVLPLCATRNRAGPFRVCELGFITVPDTQFSDAIVARDQATGACHAFADALAGRKDWDVMRLNYLKSNSVAANALIDACGARGLVALRRRISGNAYVRLDTDWKSYYDTRTRSQKKAHNLASNRLKKAGEIKVDWLAPGETGADAVDAQVQTIVDISSRSWKTRTGNSLDNPAPQAFIRRLSELAHERRWLSIWTLRLDGKPLAMEYQLVADGNAYALRSDFDHAYQEISPGTYLTRQLLEDLFSRGLVRYYMGPGDNAYKHRQTDLFEPVEEVVVYGRTAVGRMLRAWETRLKPAAKTLRERFRRSASREDGSE